MGLTGEQSQGNLVPISAGQVLGGADLAFVSALLLVEVSDLHRFPVGNALISLRCSFLSGR